MRRLVSMVLVLCLVCPALTGCASKYGEQRTTVNYYPACYRPIHDLRSRENDVAKGTAGGAIVGALGGALLGLLASGGKWQGAVVGGATGGVVGTMAGNMYARKQQEANDNIRLASYLQDIDGDISNLDLAGAAARSSLQCYDQQFRILLTQIKARQITREAAQQRFAEITSGREEAINILGSAVAHGQNLNQEYEQAFASEQQQMQTPQKLAQGQDAYVRKNRQLNSARQAKQQLVRKTQALQTDRVEAQNTTSSQIAEFQAHLADARS